MRALWRLLAALCVTLPLFGGGTPAVAQYLPPCECLDCLKLRRLATQAERKAYEDRWPIAQKELQGQIDKYNNDPVYREKFDAKGEILFCDLWETIDNELGVVRVLDIPKILRSIKAANPKCLPDDLMNLKSNLVTCEIEPVSAFLDEINEPCYELHLAALGHELTHKEDCERNQTNDWANKAPRTFTECKKAFYARTTPTPAQVMAFAKFVFATEAHAHQIESQIDRLLEKELTKQCKTGDYSADAPQRLREAAKFLKRAREYEIVLPE